jgi:hypothetical protein
MNSLQPIVPLPELDQSPLYWLAVLVSARKSRDRILEQLARRRLAGLGVRIVFTEDPADKGKGGAR